MAGVEADKKRRGKRELWSGISNWICTWISYTISERIFFTFYKLFPVPFGIIFSISIPILECLLSTPLECLLILTPADLLDSQSQSIPSGRERERHPLCFIHFHTHPAFLLSFARRQPLVIYGCARRGCLCSRRSIECSSSFLSSSLFSHRCQAGRQCKCLTDILARCLRLECRVPYAICHMPSALCLVPRVYLGDRPDRLVRSFLGLCA